MSRSFSPVGCSHGNRLPLALPCTLAYAHDIVKRPIINIEEKINRVVGMQSETPNRLSTIGDTSQSGVGQNGPRRFRVRRGVYRFKTHEEADAWMTEMLARSGIYKT